MRVVLCLVILLAGALPTSVVAQTSQPVEHRVAVGGDVGFLAPDNGEATVWKTAAGTVDAFAEYYTADHVSLRGMYGWANVPFESGSERSLRRQHINLTVIYNWRFGAFRPFAAIGGGAYFFSQREHSETVGDG